MTLAFLELPAAERKVYIDEAAARRGLAPVIVEKDFWVCWLLGILFQSSFRDAIVFKGGTSLSKVFGVINRFSEDIDLSLAPAFLGLDEPDAMAALSKGQASKWMERAETKCTAVVRDALRWPARSTEPCKPGRLGGRAHGRTPCSWPLSRRLAERQQVRRDPERTRHAVGQLAMQRVGEVRPMPFAIRRRQPAA